MLNFKYLPAKLLIGIVGRHKGDLYIEITKAAGARGGTVSPGHSLEGGRILHALALDDVAQDVVFTLMTNEADAVVKAVKAAKKLRGLAVVLDVSGMRVRFAERGADEDKSPAKEDSRSEKMESSHTLITVIVNAGHAEDVMSEARRAGATGGTILTARGTGTQEDVKFFGITLVPEKEILMIVAEKESVPKIMDAINKFPVLCQPGGGVVYCMGVEEFIILGKN